MFETHPSIINIKDHVDIGSEFSFSSVSAVDIHNEIKALDPKKNGGTIPTKQLKVVRDIVSGPIAAIWNSEVIQKKNSW